VVVPNVDVHQLTTGTSAGLEQSSLSSISFRLTGRGNSETLAVAG
jgi:hypothetical protein